MTVVPDFPAGAEPTDAELLVVTSELRRRIPIAGGRVTNTGNPIDTTSGTTEKDLAKLARTGLTLVTGRYYLARYQLTFTKTVAGDTFDLKLRANTAVSGTQVGLVGVNITDGLAIGIREFSILYVGNAAHTSLHLSVQRTAGTGTFSYYGTTAGFVRSWVMLEDKGDTDNWTDVP